MIGQTVSHYRIVEKIGEGGMGEVYLAEDTLLPGSVALKFLAPKLQQDDIARRRFIREAQSDAALDHPLVCKIYETGETRGGEDFIAMEYVEGQTLSDRLDEGLWSGSFRKDRELESDSDRIHQLMAGRKNRK